MVLIFSFWDILLNPFIYCMQWNINPTKKINTSVKNMVLILSYGDISHFSEKFAIFSVMETDPTSVNNWGNFFSYGYRLINPCNYCMYWQLNPWEISSHFSEQCGPFLIIKIEPASVNNVILFPNYGDRLLYPIHYCMQWKNNPTKNMFPLQWTIWYSLSVMEPEPTSVNNVLLSVMETVYSNPLITVCSET